MFLLSGTERLSTSNFSKSSVLAIPPRNPLGVSRAKHM
jgi:hypothetical protein